MIAADWQSVSFGNKRMCLHGLAILLGKLVLIAVHCDAEAVVLAESRLHGVFLVRPEQLRRVLDARIRSRGGDVLIQADLK